MRLRLRRVDPDNPSSTRSLARLARNLNNKPAARNNHTAQPEAEPTLNRFALKPLALGTEWASGRVAVCDAENGLGVVAFVVEDQQIGLSTAEAVAGEELVLSQLVTLGCCLPDMVRLNRIPFGHQ